MSILSTSLSIFYFHIKIGKKIGHNFNNIKCALSSCLLQSVENTGWNRLSILYMCCMHDTIYRSWVRSFSFSLQGCPIGRYDDNCSSVCPSNCNNNICDPDNGECYSCYPGWRGDTCTESNYITAWYASSSICNIADSALQITYLAHM